MPKPRPLTNVPASYDPDQQLTPRTPHSGSRTSRLEQGFHKILLSEAEANETDYDDQGAMQSAPLLASSSTGRFTMRNLRGQGSPKKDHGRPFHSMEVLSSTISRLPLAFGVFMSGILLILVVLSITKPETLHRYALGTKKTAAAHPPSDQLATSSNAIEFVHPSATPIPANTNMRVLSYENYTKFPLTGTEYLIECAKQYKTFMAHGDYWDIGPMGPMDVEHHSDSGVCSSTITYLLDGTVGLTADLALMAQAAYLARERNRTFFIEDTYWNRGKWQDHFEDVRKGQPGPQPGCKPPPPNGAIGGLPEDREVITARTAKFHFGHPFSDHYEDPYMHNLNRLKPIYESSRQSFELVIRPNEENMKLIGLARAELSAFLRDANQNQLYVAAHIRRGDKKSLSYTFLNRLIPVQDYVNAVKSTWARLHIELASHTNPVVYVATDSPDAYAQFLQLYNGEVFSLFKASDPRLQSVASPGEYYQQKFNELDPQSRTAATRGVVVDLAMVSGLWAEHPKKMNPDAVICALSSTICKLAAIGLGWDNAFGNVDEMGAIDNKQKRWVEIDQKGLIVPVWLPFELF